MCVPWQNRFRNRWNRELLSGIGIGIAKIFWTESESESRKINISAAKAPFFVIYREKVRFGSIFGRFLESAFGLPSQKICTFKFHYMGVLISDVDSINFWSSPNPSPSPLFTSPSPNPSLGHIYRVRIRVRRKFFESDSFESGSNSFDENEVQKWDSRTYQNYFDPGYRVTKV